MKLTNRYLLPDTLVRATQKRNDHYDRGPVNRSATQLVSPPQIDILRKAYFAKMESDVVDEFWSLLGTAVHHLLEMGATSDMIVEERLFAEVDGWTISGAIDLQEPYKEGGQQWVDVSDYKVVSVYMIQKEEGDAAVEWEQQQNIYRWLIEKTKPGWKVRSLNIIAVIRDWQRAKAAADPLYPSAPIIRIHVPLWSFEDAENFIRGRVHLHREAEMLHGIEGDLPECSAEERWERGARWNVIKKGGKRSYKSCRSEEEAEAILSTLEGNYEIIHKPGKAFRCEGNFCRVAEWCHQYKRMKGEGIRQDETP